MILLSIKFASTYRNDHRLSFTFSHPSKNMSCGICRQKIEDNYGKYSCIKGCTTYEVHSKWATQRDVWNGVDLEDEPEEVYESINSFEVIGGGIIQHFSHLHHMRFDMLYDEKIRCKTMIYFL